MRTVFIAEDGTEFDEEVDCREYEKGLKYGEMGRDIIGWNVDWEEVSYRGPTFCDEVTYLHIKTDDAAESFMRRCEEDESCSLGIKGAGLYFWNTYNLDDFAELDQESWILVADAIEYYENQVAIMQHMFKRAKAG